MKKLLCAAALLCAAMTVHASDTSFFATVTDTDGQVWLNGTWNATLSLPSGPFGNQTPTIGGVAVPTKKKGIINAFGQIVTTLTDTSSLDQAGGVWSVQACPNASTADYADTGCVTVKSSISGSTVDLTARFTGVAAPRFPAGPNAYGYSDIEVLTPSIPGEQYYNTGNNLLIAGLRIWDGKVWQGVGASGGGGAANPAGQDQDVQINKTVGDIKQFNADPGRFTYNNTTHMLKSNANGNLNPDLYAGTNGIATALASPECTGSCVVTQPITTSDSAAVPAPTADTPQVVESQRNGSWMRFWHNPGYNNSTTLGGTGVGHYDYGTYDTPNPLSSSSVVFNPNHTAIWGKFNGWGWNYGNGPGVTGHAWMADNTLLVHADVNNQGIAQGINVNVNKYATGDLGPLYLTGFSDLGSPDYSAEGTNVITAKGGQNGSYFHGTVGAGASSGGTALPIVYNASYSPSTLNRNATSSGGIMLDTNQLILASSVTGPAVITGYGGTFSSLPIAGTVTPSTAYGVINCTMPNNVGNPNLSQSIRCPIISVQGTAGEFTPGFAVIAGDYPEKVLITAVDPKGGTTQFVTFTYTKPHAVGGASVKNPVLFQGSNVIGSYIVYDNATATNGFTIPYNVYGAPDANHIFVEQSFSVGQGAYTVYDPPTPITSLTKSGTTVTATYLTSSLNLFARQAAGVVSGCSDSGLNGAATNITTDPMTLKMTFTEAAGGTGCSGALIQMPTSYRSFKLYPGAEVRSPGGVTAPATITLEPNNVAWATNDNIENAFQPFAKTGEGFMIHNTFNSLSGNSNGILFVANGAGVSGKYNFFSLSNPNPCTIYKGCGGTLDAPIIMSTGGHGSSTPNAGFLSLAEAPLNGAPVITVGPPDPAIGGTSNVSPVNLITVTSSTANSGTLYYSPQYQSFMGPNFMTGGPGSLGTGIVTAAKFFVNGYMNDGPIPGQITFGNNVSTGLVPMGLCDHYIPSSTEVTIGNCTPIAGTGINITDGKLNVGTFRSQGTTSLGTTTIGLQAPNYNPASVYSGTAGATSRSYFYVAVSPLGIMGPASTYTAVNTAATLSASNKVTTTCPTSLQTNYPAGTTYVLLALSGVNVYRNLGTCTLNSTVVDDGSVTSTFTGPTLNANLPIAAGQYQVSAGGGVGFYLNNIGGAMDTFLNRIGANTLGIGSTMGSAHNGRLDAGNITLDAVTGGGTQCLHADNAGNITGTGADCGAGGGGGGSVTSFSASGPGSLFTTSVANSTTTPALSFTLTSAGPHAFFGNCSGTTGTPNYCQPSYADLGGSVPTWNQNTTGTAANLSGTPALPNGTTATTQSVGDNSTKIATTAFVLANAGGGSGITGLTTGYLPQATSSTAIGNSFIDCGITNAAACTSSKDFYAPTFHSTDTSGVGFGSVGAEGTAPSGVSGQDGMWADSTAHRWKMNNNNAGARFMVGQATAGTAGHIPVYDSSGVDLVDSGAAGVTASGTSCTITAITNGIITGATCTP